MKIGQMGWALITVCLLGACSSEENRTMVGTLERDRIELKVESSEPLVNIAVTDGQAVTAGDLVAEQDPSRARARLAQFTAQRDQVAARLAELERGPRQESIRQARAELQASIVRTNNARANLERDREVYEKGLSTQAQLDFTETNFKAANAGEEARREALEAMLNGTTAEELQQAVAAVAAADAMMAQAQIDLDRTRIVAPVDGIVDKVLFQLGERPQPGTTLTVVLASARVFARVYVPEAERAVVRPGDSLKVHIDGVEQPLNGRVRWVSSDASFTPYFALTEHDRSRLSYIAEVDIPEAASLPSGVPLVVELPSR